MLRANYLCVLAALTPAVAQTPQPPPDFGAAEKRAIEWSVLAANLEQRLARLLPCDARVRSALDEVSRASDARLASLTSYWQAAVAAFKEQTEASRGSLAQQEAAAASWNDDIVDATEESAAFAGRAAQLTTSARNASAFLDARTALDRIARASQQAAGQAREREAAAGRLLTALRENIAASQARQLALEDAIKTLTEESQRWRAYYAARAARAQTECAITERSAAPGPAPPTRRDSKAAPPPAKKKERP